MKQKLDRRVTYFEEPAYLIAKAIKKRGYFIADSCGMERSEPLSDLLGIIGPREEPELIEKSFFGFKYNVKRKHSRRPFIGLLYLNCNFAKVDRNWILEVYGRKNVLKLTELVKELSAFRGVRVQVRLESELQKKEVYMSDIRGA